MSKSTISLLTLFQQISDEESAKLFLEGKIWQNTPIFPYCSSTRITMNQGNRSEYHRCKDCLKDFTIRTGTIFAGSHIPLHKWIYAIYMVMTARKGISSMQLAKELGIRQGSAWFLLQRIREACKKDDDHDSQGGIGSLLDGIVEIDETYRW